MNKKTQLGQYFTPFNLVNQAIELIKNNGDFLEPSAGGGAFFKSLPKDKTVSIEIDNNVISNNHTICMDFFLFSTDNKFDTIIGNPPFVSYKNISELQQKSLKYDILNKRSNLFTHFVYKSLKHLKKGGELIFFAPKEFLYNSSNFKLLDLMFQNGQITHIIDYGEEKVFEGVSQNIILFRYEKTDTPSKTLFYNNKEILYTINNGYLQFFNDLKSDTKFIPLKTIFDVKVGGFTGLDSVFRNDKGNIEIVYSQTKNTGNTIKVFYGEQAIPYLEPHKTLLLKRGCKTFDEHNWFEWCRNLSTDLRPKIYVNTKTRDKKPFFLHKCPYFDGSIIALIPKEENADINQYVEMLNSQKWNFTGNRLQFSQSQLENHIITV